jgi:chromosome partitioning protein
MGGFIVANGTQGDEFPSTFPGGDWPEVVDSPRVILYNIRSKPLVKPHLIVFANEKGGVGKSTLAFHTCVGLCSAGEKVAVLDLDRRQQSLADALASREATARGLEVDLPSPRYTVLENQSGSMLAQEISRIGAGSRFVIIDLAGQDSTVARYAIALANTLITPINNSLVDIDALAKIDPVNMRVKEPNRFANLVEDLRRERELCGMPPIDWVVVKNRLRTAEKKQRQYVDQALNDLSQTLRFRVTQGLSERVAYRELYLFGLTHLDLKLFPPLSRLNKHVEPEVSRLISDLALDRANPGQESLYNSKETARCFKAEEYRNSLFATR